MAALFVQVVGQGQVIGAGGLHYKLAVRTARLDQLLKASFGIADFQVFDLLINLVADRQRSFAHIQADHG
ncbi:hypothetical protein GCM10023172_42720 [Hymenobacter ginsengisoli]|uniref:Uncharacterized protein n=1 Tax=Hymenobacter ginsengisoli TaxID=1051626 RepID=A0ABP8QRC0_9BACT